MASTAARISSGGSTSAKRTSPSPSGPKLPPGVQTTPDLHYAKVFFSVLDKDQAKETLKGLKSAGGWLRRELGAKLQLRYTPELVWEEDTSITHGARIFDILATLDIPEDTNEAE